METMIKEHFQRINRRPRRWASFEDFIVQQRRLFSAKFPQHTMSDQEYTALLHQSAARSGGLDENTVRDMVVRYKQESAAAFISMVLSAE